VAMLILFLRSHPESGLDNVLVEALASRKVCGTLCILLCYISIFSLEADT
jgi:hypothetical protein